jgi:benzoylformate decarboxylase
VPQPYPRPKADITATAPFSAEAVFDILEETKPPDAVVVNESTANTVAFWQRVRFDRSRSFYFPSAGSLGFGIPAVIGAQMGDPSRPVIGVIGDGSANYAIAGLWTAARYRIPATFVIMRNEEYGALKWFAGVLKTGRLPEMDLPGIDYCAIARGYGVRAFRVSHSEELVRALRRSVVSGEPELIEVPIQPEGTKASKSAG